MVRPGYKRTEVGEIPEDWECPLLDSVAIRASGHTPDKAHPEYWNGPIAWISLQDTHRLDRPQITETAATVTEAGIRNSSARLLPAGTVVLSRDAGVGRSSIMSKSMAVSQHFMAWTCGPKLSNYFLYYWLQRTKPEFERIAIGNTIKTIGLPYFKALRVPLPPRPQQDAIAVNLGEADALIDSLDHLLAKKRAIKQGAMQSLLTGAKRLPGFSKPWEARSLGSIGRFLKGNGVTRDQANSGHLPCVRYGEIYTHHTDVIRQFFSWISPDVAATALHLQGGDLLFSGSGETKEEIGKCVAFVHEVEAYAGGDIVVLRPSWGHATFLGYFLNTQPIVRQKASRGQGDAVVHISSRSLAEVAGSFPQPAEQAAIAEVLTDLDAGLDATTAKLHKARAIKQGMMQELLTGRIRLV